MENRKIDWEALEKLRTAFTEGKVDLVVTPTLIVSKEFEEHARKTVGKCMNVVCEVDIIKETK